MKKYNSPIRIRLLCPRTGRNEGSPDQMNHGHLRLLLRTVQWKSVFGSQHNWVLGLTSNSWVTPPCVAGINGVCVLREKPRHLLRIFLGSHARHGYGLSFILGEDNTDGARVGNNHTCNSSLGLWPASPPCGFWTLFPTIVWTNFLK